MTAVCILSAATVQTSVWICVFKWCLGEVCRVERGGVLYCIGRGSTGCFTIVLTLTGLRRCLDTKGKKISTSLRDTNRFLV
jgi:hypothetical protein